MTRAEMIHARNLREVYEAITAAGIELSMNRS